jgi:hypothetical protein
MSVKKPVPAVATRPTITQPVPVKDDTNKQPEQWWIKVIDLL